MEAHSITEPDGIEAVYRREALGAFAHEVRTPLTAIRMVLELASRDGATGALVLDRELASMLSASLDDLQGLADDLQETSRIERGKVALIGGQCNLREAYIAATEPLMRAHIALAGEAPPSVMGPWDLRYLTRAIAGFADTANRSGAGSGEVQFESSLEEGAVRLTFASGTPGGAPKAIASDAGFSFFRARQFVLAMGGRVEWDRAEHYLSVNATLPLA